MGSVSASSTWATSSLIARRLSAPGAVLAFIVLPACSALFHEEKAAYPLNWSPVQQTASTGACPRIEGVFIDGGEYKAPGSGRPCDYGEGECQSLLFALLYDYKPVRKRSVYAFFTANANLEVRIEQPSEDEIKIAGYGEERTLKKAAGDFTCDKDGLRLAEKTSSTLLLLLDNVSHESRIFNVAQDGSLVMKSEWHNAGNYTIFPFSVRAEGWVTWKRAGAGKSSEQRFPPRTP